MRSGGGVGGHGWAGAVLGKAVPVFGAGRGVGGGGRTAASCLYMAAADVAP